MNEPCTDISVAGRQKGLEDEEGNSLKGMAEIILSKHRNGPIGDVHLRFREECAKFVELEDDFLAPISDDDDTEASAVTLSSKMNDESDSNKLSKDADYSEETPF